ncbi:MAG: AMP-binding protein [Hyphomonas sp.]|jgi:bile acid-coenzyme A ligase|uniref:AMP-binding protein n=1 Tax=Hyphomonas sp. TaxID=87 RepID=UPI003263BB1B
MNVKPHSRDLISAPRGLGWILTYRANLAPDQACYTIRDTTLTRGELDLQANRMARALLSRGVKKDDLVAICLPNSPAHHIFAFAIWKIGATPMPLSPKLPASELREILRLASPALLVGSIPGVRLDLPVMAGDFVPDPLLPDHALPEAIASSVKAITSGGSTGRPKIIVDGRPSTLIPDEPSPFLQIRIDDIMLHPAPPYHSAGFMQMNWGLAWGAHIICMEKFDAEDWLRLVEKHRVRWAYLVPTMMSRIWSLPDKIRNQYDVSSLEVVIHMASPCPDWLKAAWIDWLGPDRIFEVYAGSEGIAATLITGTEWLQHRGSVGKPAQEVRILSEDNEPLPQGEIGEIYFRMPTGNAAPYRYIGAEARKIDAWESLGDMGYLDRDGYLYIADRRTDMIVSGGVNIYPAEIEAALEAHPHIFSSAVVGLPHADFGRVPHAIIELEPGSETLTAQDIEAHLTERLVRYKLPYTYEYTSAPLRDASGKMRRSALRDDCELRLMQGKKFPGLRTAR